MSLTYELRPYGGNTQERTPGRKNTEGDVLQMQVRCFYVRVKMKMSRGPRPIVRHVCRTRSDSQAHGGRIQARGAHPDGAAMIVKDPARPGWWTLTSCPLLFKQVLLQATLLLHNNLEGRHFYIYFTDKDTSSQESSDSPDNTPSHGRAGEGRSW